MKKLPMLTRARLGLRRFINRISQPLRTVGGGQFHWIPHQGTAGVVVTHDNALQLSACFACVRVIAEDIGKMPWHVLLREGEKRVNQEGSPLYRLLNTRPNPEMSSMEFRVTLLIHAQIWGNGYAEIERDRANRPIALWIIEAWRVIPRRINGKLLYEVVNDAAQNGFVEPENMFHIHTPSLDGIVGIDTVGNAALTLGFGIAAEQYGASFYENNTTLGTSFKTENPLSDAAYERLKKELDDKKGSKRAFDGTIFEEGLEPVSVLMKQTDAQYLETRLYQLQEICRFFRVPPQKIYDLKEAHFRNLESLNIIYVTDSLHPWAKRLEEEADAKLTSLYDRRFTKINFVELLRGDPEKRAKYYKEMFFMGVFTQNKILSLEGEDPIPASEGGDERFMQSQMVTVKSIIDGTANPKPLPALPDSEGGADNDPQNIIKPVIRNLLKRFWDTDKKRATPIKEKAEFADYYDWLQKHFANKGLRKTREQAVLDVIEAAEKAYNKQFDFEVWLQHYQTWATGALVYFYKDQAAMMNFDAFCVYFLECLNYEDSSKEKLH